MVIRVDRSTQTNRTQANEGGDVQTPGTPQEQTRPAGWQPGAAERTRVTGQRGVVTADPGGGVTAAGLNPAVSPERQRQTFENVFKLGRELVAEGKVPVIVIDHRLTGMDDRPIIKAGLKELATANDISELKDVDAALKNGTLKFLPGYTEQASDHWRAEHQELVNKYPGAFGAPGTRIPINFMGHSPREANAVDGLAELQARWKLETGGKGQIIFAGSGTGSREDFVNVYSRPKSEGGAGLPDPDVRFGAPSPSAEATAKAEALVAAYNAKHGGEEPVRLDGDSRGKAGWIETIERENVDGQPKVVAAFIDDRAHNRFGAAGAGALGERMMMIKSAAPGISFAQTDNDNPNLISTFKPNP